MPIFSCFFGAKKDSFTIYPTLSFVAIFLTIINSIHQRNIEDFLVSFFKNKPIMQQ